jgi:hypothetical protein
MSLPAASILRSSPVEMFRVMAPCSVSVASVMSEPLLPECKLVACARTGALVAGWTAATATINVPTREASLHMAPLSVDWETDGLR